MEAKIKSNRAARAIHIITWMIFQLSIGAEVGYKKERTSMWIFDKWMFHYASNNFYGETTPHKV